MTTATASLHAKLVDAFIAARNAALAADPGQDNDGGTCNFDTPAIRIDRLPEPKLIAAASEAGLTVCGFGWFGKRWYWLNVPLNGQGDRRTTMSDAAYRTLRDQLADEPRVHIHHYMQAD